MTLSPLHLVVNWPVFTILYTVRLKQNTFLCSRAIRKYWNQNTAADEHNSCLTLDGSIIKIDIYNSVSWIFIQDFWGLFSSKFYCFSFWDQCLWCRPLLSSTKV